MVVTKNTTLSVLLCALTFLWTMETVYGYTSPYVHGGKPGKPGKRVSKRLKPDFKFKTRRFFFFTSRTKQHFSSSRRSLPKFRDRNTSQAATNSLGRKSCSLKAVLLSRYQRGPFMKSQIFGDYFNWYVPPLVWYNKIRGNNIRATEKLMVKKLLHVHESDIRLYSTLKTKLTVFLFCVSNVHITLI